ncbi:MAG: flagellar export protein FliJ [Pirellulales bacterium]|nr:flagellar export protein FliJ [Pirellulales bacterium]
MAKFTFRLATLLKIREAARDERRAELAQAYQADAALQEEHRRLAELLAQMADVYRNASAPGVIDVERLLETQRHDMLVRVQIQYLEKQRAAVAEEIERRRAVLAEANRQVKVLENLRERQLERHREEEGLRERKQLDEAALIRSVLEVPR